MTNPAQLEAAVKSGANIEIRVAGEIKQSLPFTYEMVWEAVKIIRTLYRRHIAAGAYCNDVLVGEVAYNGTRWTWYIDQLFIWYLRPIR